MPDQQSKPPSMPNKTAGQAEGQRAKPGDINYGALGSDGAPVAKSAESPRVNPRPTVGLIVHFRSKAAGEVGNNRAYAPAIVTWVHGDTARVNLMVFRDNENVIPFPSVDYEGNAVDAVRSWSWPPLV